MRRTPLHKLYILIRYLNHSNWLWVERIHAISPENLLTSTFLLPILGLVYQVSQLRVVPLADLAGVLLLNTRFFDELACAWPPCRSPTFWRQRFCGFTWRFHSANNLSLESVSHYHFPLTPPELLLPLHMPLLLSLDTSSHFRVHLFCWEFACLSSLDNLLSVSKKAVL